MTLYKRHLLCLLIAFSLLGVAVLGSAPAQIEQELPPRPTITNTPQVGPPPPTARPGVGGLIELQAHYAANWPWQRQPWYNVWSSVQQWVNWKQWQDVAGWQGELDDIYNDQGDIWGRKTWWVADPHLGLSRYRWALYESKGGRLLAVSDPFDLPAASGQKIIISVWLAP